MANISFFSTNTKVEQPTDLEKALDACKNKFNQMLTEVLKGDSPSS